MVELVGFIEKLGLSGSERNLSIEVEALELNQVFQNSSNRAQCHPVTSLHRGYFSEDCVCAEEGLDHKRVKHPFGRTPTKFSNFLTFLHLWFPRSLLS